MALYFLTYDLRNNRNYQKLYDELDNFNAVRVLESTWSFNRINTTANNLKDYFKSFVDNDDGLLIVEARYFATFNTISTPNRSNL